MSRDVMERAKQIKEKDQQIQKLQGQCDVVEEAICQKCQNSLEESFYHSDSKPKHKHSSSTDADSDQKIV